MINDDIEKRVTVLEDIEAIKRLKARYCAICDDDHNPGKIATVFTEDGIWEGGDFGEAQGHQAIRKLFEGFQRLISFSQHNLMNPIIEVEGDRAKGTWYLMGPFTFREKNEAKWLAACYQDDYIKVAGEWKHQHLRATIRMIAPYEKGWANKE
jgi:hypothetical protein